MKEMLGYRDHCEISRPLVDANGDVVYKYDEPQTDIVYSGPCDFQPGGQTALSIVTHNDVVYIPQQVSAEEGDIVEVVSRWGRKRYSVASAPQELDLEVFNTVCVTEIELKRGS